MSLKRSSSLMTRSGARGSADFRRFELALGQRLLAAAHRVEDGGDLVEADRPDVVAVDRGHRRHVARAQALEGADVELGVVAAVLVEGGEQLVGAAQRARDVGAHEDVVAAHRLREEHVVEGRHRDEVARRQAHDARHLLDALRRAPAVQVLHGVQRRDRRRAMVGVARHVGLDRRPQLLGHRRGGGVGDLLGVLGEVRGLVPAGNARAVPEARHACRVDRHYRSMPPRIGSSAASVAIMSAM